MSLSYLIRRAKQPPALEGQWDEAPWDQAPALDINHFHRMSSDHHPLTQAKALYNEKGIYVAFKVMDRYMRCVWTERMDPVWLDSCCEFFVRPKPGKGYFNFEINCGGALLASYVWDWRRDEAGKLAGSEPIEDTLASEVAIYHSMPSFVSPEIETPTEWRLEYFIPFSLFEVHVGALGEIAGKEWRANFYKCGDETSHPHWASWAPIGDALNFHVPDHFAPIVFEK
ncbi:MAG: carbohydrate-binding family 9-like protein [Candidatus Sumerlaeota bacterium]|nr:carbohydrate-binding family 9-like protein [Candidatus Sumerlaeota bacterium]